MDAGLHTQTQSSRNSPQQSEGRSQHGQGYRTTEPNLLEVRQDLSPHSVWDADRVPAAMFGPSRFSSEAQEQLLGDEGPGGPQHSPAAWTNVTTNDLLVQHLLGLYFCWEYPTFASLSKEHFLVDYNAGRHRFCSPLLVNALLAIGAKFTDVPEARQNPDDPGSAGDHFFHEAQRLLALAEIPSLTTIQALNLMALRQASSGNDLSSWHYARQAMRIAIDLDLPSDESSQEHSTNDSYPTMDRQVRAATFWGCLTLEQ